MVEKYRWLITIIVLIALGGCSQYVEGTEIPFTRVAEFNELVGSNPDHYQDEATMVLMISQSDEKIQLEALVPKHLKPTIHEVSPDRQIVIALFQGEKRSSGYGVTITKIVYAGSDVYIYTRFDTPQRGQLQEGGTRSPVSIVSIERGALPANEPLSVHLMGDATKQEVLVQEYTVK